MTHPSDPNSQNGHSTNSDPIEQSEPSYPPEGAINQPEVPAAEPIPTELSPTQEENLESLDSQEAQRQSWKWFKRISLGVGAFVFLGVVGGAWYGWMFVRTRLSPLVSANLSTTFNRPVQLGEVTGVGINSIRFGETTIPPTATDPDRATTEAVEVTFNPLTVLFDHELNLDVTLVNPKAFLEQNQQGQWVNVTLTEQKPGAIDINLKTLRVRNAVATLFPYEGRKDLQAQGAKPDPKLDPKPTPNVVARNQILFNSLEGVANFIDDNTRITLDFRGRQEQGGRFNIVGEWFSPLKQASLQLRGTDLSAAPLSKLVLGIPVDLQSGTANGNVNVKFGENQPTRINGTANFENIAGRYQPGNQPVGGIQFPQFKSEIPLEITQAKGGLRFQDQLITLENVSALYAGKIPVQVGGAAHLERGVELRANVNPVAIATLIDTLKLKLPVTATGEIKAAAAVRGPYDKIVALAEVASTKPTTIDRVELTNFTAQVGYADSTVFIESVQAKPTLGGEIQGRGQVKLNTPQGVVFDFIGRDVPVRQLAQLYAVNTENLNLETVTLKGQIGGPLNDLQLLAETNLGGGNVRIGSKIIQGNILTEVLAERVQLESVVQASAFGENNAQVSGLLRTPVSGRFQVVTPLENASLNTLQAAGSGNLNYAGGNVQVGGKLEGGQWQGAIATNNVRLKELLPNLPVNGTLPFTGQFEFTGTTQSFALNQINGSGQGRVQVAGGVVDTRIGLRDGNWQADLQANQILPNRLSAQIPPNLITTPVTGRFQLAGTLDNFDLNQLQASGQGRLSVAGGIVDVGGRLSQGQLQAEVAANQVQLGTLAPGLPNALQTAFSGNVQLAGNINDLNSNTVQAQARGALALGGGVVTINNSRLNQGRWQANITAQGVQLDRTGFAVPALLAGTRGGGQFNVSGTVDSFAPDSIRAEGQAVVAQLPILESGPAGVNFAWNGQRLQILDGGGQGLRVNGVIDPNFDSIGRSQFNLNVQVANVDLAQAYRRLPLPGVIPNNVQLAGNADFAGRVAGTLETPAIDGQVQLRGLQVNDVAFDPVLAGPVQISRSGGNLQLTGTDDRILLALNQNFRPESFEVKLDDAIARGRTTGDNLAVNVENFPVALLNLRPPQGVLGDRGILRGSASGNVEVNLNQLAATGNLTVNQPSWGTIQGQNLTTQFSYRDGIGQLNNTVFTIGESRYELAANLNLTGNDPRFTGNVKIAQGNIQDILELARWFEIADIGKLPGSFTYGTATDVRTIAVGLPNTPLLTQLRRFSEIAQLVETTRNAEENAPIPTLADLEGEFGGEIQIAGSLNQGLKLDFDLSGQDWQWGDYEFNRLTARGNFENGILSLVPVRVESDQTLIAFNGQIGGTQQSGQLRVENLPVELIERFRPLPVDVAGNINATATLLGGTLANPRLIGELNLTDGTLNRTPIQSATGTFSLADARLNFDSRVFVSGPQPLTIEGSIPNPIPLGSVSPINQQIALDVNVQNEGLGLLNVFTQDQVRWISGNGNVNLQIRGTLNEPIATGIVRIDDATLAAAAIPDPLTNVAGILRFERDRIFVDNLTGDFSRGQITAQGSIPLANPRIADASITSNPLTVGLNNLALNLKGIYSGGASGNVVIGGAALEPVIGGEILLKSGTVFLSENPTATTVSRPSNAGRSGANISPLLNDLKITLGQNIEIVQQPILRFRVAGDLTINGTLDQLRPSGVIDIQRGSVNLYATQFRLDRSYQNRATFTPAKELDPQLDVRLVANVSEARGTIRQAATPSTGEIAVPAEYKDDLPLVTGTGLQNVRIFATVDGPASQLFDSLTLTSSPSRSETEIVSLIGGGFINTLGRGDSTLALANLAGSALLSNIQTVIGDALGLSDFRLFTTLSSSGDTSRSNIDLGAEASIDVTGKFSTSVLKILTNNQSPLFSIRYRLNDQLMLRGATNLSNDNRIQLEYESRF